MEIALKEVWYSYNGEDFVLKNISLKIEKAGIYVIYGPNGAGKTTLLKILSLILKPSIGNVYLNNKEFWSLSQTEREMLRKEIVYVHDKPILLRGNVEYNVKLGLMLRKKENNPLFDFLIEKYGLKELKSQHAKGLSAGQGKIVSILRALILLPKILVIDEPFTFLDSNRIKLLIEDLAGIARSGGKVIMATHFMFKELEDNTKNFIKIVDGKVVETQGDIVLIENHTF